MVKFLDGPAKGKALALQRAPLLLRVVIAEAGNIDALDQPDDIPTQHEKVTVYERVGEAGQYIMCLRGYGCHKRAEAEYRQCDAQPSDEVARDNRRWQQWCIERCAEEGSEMASHNHPACEVCKRQDGVVKAEFRMCRGGATEFEMRVLLCENCASLVKYEAVSVLQGEGNPNKGVAKP